MSTTRRATLLILCWMPLACAAPSAPSTTPQPDPSTAEVPLDCAEGWRAALVYDAGETGIWAVRALPVFPQYAAPEVVGLDDRGRCVVLVGYSGKWTPLVTMEEREWLGAMAHGEVDPRVDGPELYVAGKRGNVHQLRVYTDGGTDQRRIARLEGREVHTLLAGDLDPRTPGPELLVFTRPGTLYRVTPSGDDGAWESERLAQLPGRVRDAAVLPAAEGERPWIATVARSGALALLRIEADGPRWRTVHESPTGMGRLALAPPRPGRGTLLYSTRDDGVVLRHEEHADGTWDSAPIHLGPQGPRGLAAGRFHADPDVESVAVFGYSARVELLTRGADGWQAETIFVDRDRGHWLGACELDSRNATDELVGSGYGGRIFLLARPPGTGLEAGHEQPVEVVGP